MVRAGDSFRDNLTGVNNQTPVKFNYAWTADLFGTSVTFSETCFVCFCRCCCRPHYRLRSRFGSGIAAPSAPHRALNTDFNVSLALARIPEEDFLPDFLPAFRLTFSGEFSCSCF